MNPNRHKNRSRERVHHSQTSQVLIQEWDELCARYLPGALEKSFWRYSRIGADDGPEQGWKLHVAATVLTACDVLRRVAPYLMARGVLFKAPRSLAELSQLNCGLYQGYSQIGKFITVYPPSPTDALTIARKLHRITYGLPAPRVPFDEQYRPHSCVFYRYGAFTTLTVPQPDGTTVLAMRGPDGELVPDRRGPGHAVPEWTTDPFQNTACKHAETRTPNSPLGSSLFGYKALSQRGKGGVYKALDVSVRPPRLCILKEGRRNGETNWDGRDGYWRIEHERDVLRTLARARVNVPRIYKSFRSTNHYYLSTEMIEGRNLLQIISESERLPALTSLRYGLQLAELLSAIHEAGWVWRDCKPSNLMITGCGEMRPIDFEGAHRINKPDLTPWGTPGYVPPEWQISGPSAFHSAQDLYALGAVLHQLFYGTVPKSQEDVVTTCEITPIGPLITSLLSASPELRPDATSASNVLRKALAKHAGA
jgi:Protein kinase domain